MSNFPHGGDVRGLAAASGRTPEEFLDFSASINPLGPPEWLRPVISSAVSQLVHYPDPHCRELIRTASSRFNLPEAMIVAGNGTSELLFALVRASGLTQAAIPSPCYCDYRTACVKAGIDPMILPMREEHGFGLDPKVLSDALSSMEAPALAFITRPNNPTGLDVPASDVRSLCEAHPDCLFVVDEAFGSFVDGFESLVPDLPANVCVLLSLTKMFAIPGLRLGLAVAQEGLAARLRDALAPWSVNALAQAVGVRAIGDAAFEKRTRDAVRGLRQQLAEGLATLPGLNVLSGSANYLFCRLDDPVDAPALNRGLLLEGMAVRDCSNFAGLDSRFVRIAVRPQAENLRLLDSLAAILGAPGTAPRRKHTPALMVQGTTSNAGKSVLAAALCRILQQDGVRVAPFKAQNMSLNSHVTLRGEEMGRAQVLQARACGIEPDARMNPVLLKPCSDTGSQVIVMGRPVGNMRVKEYVAYKPTAFAAAKEAYASLADEYDAIILEGAGSPAEVNLKHHDMVNMAMAAHAGARVLLVGDIDRGGVFAALSGTMELLSESERALVGGYVLNRFRGDPSLLDPAHRFMLETTGKPVLGVVPNIEAHGLPEEDSVSFKAGQCFTPTSERDVKRDLDIAIVDIPHISNFTDFDALFREPDVSLRVVRSPDELGRPDALILPGSKNTLADRATLEQSGLAHAIRALESTEIVGICAGLQVLGQTLLDPLGLESSLGSSPGLGFLPLTTQLMADKTLRRTQAVHLPSGLPLDGYEIHHGATTSTGQDTAVLANGADGSPLAWSSSDGRVWGTYLHGVFDADGFRRWWLNTLRSRKGLPSLPEQPSTSLDAALDRLAEVVRASLDMKAVYALLGL